MKMLWFDKQKFIALSILLAACSGGGSSDSSDTGTAQPAATAGVETTFTGSIKSVSGSQSEMKDWIVLLINYDSFVTSVGVVNAAGNFSLSNVMSTDRYTIALLDPSYKLQAVLSAAGAEGTKTIRQVFKLSGTQLPILVHNGPIVNFTNTVGISFESPTVPDENQDLIPPGQETSLAETSTEDKDQDGIVNSIDPDIDGDGLINVLDLDDDGDSIPDAFDDDSNGDTIADVNQSLGDLYFSSLLNFLSVQVVQDTQSDGSFATSLLITAKTSGTTAPTALAVRSSSDLFSGANSIRINPETGDTIAAPWDLALSDDGLNEDGAASDGTYVRRVKLGTGILPLAQQMLFIQYKDTVLDVARVRELPYIFPNVTSAAITGSYASSTRTVTLGGSPFGSGETRFKWWVDIYDSTGKKIFSSAPQAGTGSTYVIPATALQSGVTYTAKITATTPERIPSYPAWIVRSASFNL